MDTVSEALLFDHLRVIFRLQMQVSSLIENKGNFDATYLPFLNTYPLLGSLTK